mmetsp:Transcript_16800/g.33441  ORF Transcript_16800/g.33441 Transcript_16800/m.33441 type:complete len:95 (+) Transcript_16800:464-748(+)
MTVVVSCPTSLSCPMISFSVAPSRLEVGSSHSRIRAPLSVARAMATRCFSPPESLRPRSPTTVSYPSGRRRMASWIRARRAASSTSSSVASMRP